MDTIDGMRTFVAAVQGGSFSTAARRLEMSPQLVSKYVARLEQRLGVRLLNRSTRHLSLTEAGRAYVERCRQILADLDELESVVGDMTTAAEGTLRINGPMAFGTTHLAPAIAAYQAAHPGVDIEFVMNDRVIDVLAEGFDLAIRIGTLEESALIARLLAPVRLVVCAAPDYLARHGRPAEPADLARHNCLVYAYYSTRADWTFRRDGLETTVHVQGRLVANNGDALCAAAVAGAGIILVPNFIAGEDLAAGRLQTVLDDYALPDVGIYAVYAHRQYLSAKVRTFVDFLATYFGDPPYWERAAGPRSP